MKYNPDVHHRKSIRLRGYDYSQTGAYFITICTYNRECLFGKIVPNGRGAMHCALTEIGNIANNEWLKTSEIRKNIQLDSFIVMPNHIHGIIVMHAQPTGAYGNHPKII
jgi:putative transposase